MTQCTHLKKILKESGNSYERNVAQHLSSEFTRKITGSVLVLRQLIILDHMPLKAVHILPTGRVLSVPKSVRELFLVSVES